MQRRKLRAKRLNKKNEMTGALVYLVNLKILHLSKKKQKNKNKQIKSKVVQNRVELKFVDEKAIPIVAIN